MQQRERGTEELVAVGGAERADVAHAIPIDVGSDLAVEVLAVVNDARDHER